MKGAALNIIIGAATIAVSVWLLQKYFTVEQEQPTVNDDLAQDDRNDVLVQVQDTDECLFPNEMLIEEQGNQVSNWGNLSGRRFLQYKNQNPPTND